MLGLGHIDRYAVLQETDGLMGADGNLLLGRPRPVVVDTPSAGPLRISRSFFLLGIAAAGCSLVP